MYLLSFDLMLIAPLLVAFSAAVFGIIFLINGYRRDADGKYDQAKVSRGFKCLIIGTIVSFLSSGIVLPIMESEIANGSKPITDSWFGFLLLLPVIVLGGVGFIVFCFLNGIRYTKKTIIKDGVKKLDVETATFGCILLGLGTLFVVAWLFFLTFTAYPNWKIL